MEEEGTNAGPGRTPDADQKRREDLERTSEDLWPLEVLIWVQIAGGECEVDSDKKE